MFTRLCCLITFLRERGLCVVLRRELKTEQAGIRRRSSPSQYWHTASPCPRQVLPIRTRPARMCGTRVVKDEPLQTNHTPHSATIFIPAHGLPKSVRTDPKTQQWTPQAGNAHKLAVCHLCAFPSSNCSRVGARWQERTKIERDCQAGGAYGPEVWYLPCSFPGGGLRSPLPTPSRQRINFCPVLTSCRSGLRACP